MKHPIYYIIVATLAALLSISLFQSIADHYVQPLLWLVIITMIICGMIAISVSMFRYSRKLASVN